MGSFCNLAGALIDFGDGHEDGDGILVAGGGAAGETLGLHGAQGAQGGVEGSLVVGGVALEPVEGFGGLFLEHGFGAALLHECGFDEAATAQAPSGVEGEFELHHLDAVSWAS